MGQMADKLQLFIGPPALPGRKSAHLQRLRMPETPYARAPNCGNWPFALIGVQNGHFE